MVEFTYLLFPIGVAFGFWLVLRKLDRIEMRIQTTEMRIQTIQHESSMWFRRASGPEWIKQEEKRYG